MATFVLVPGAGSDSWYWHRVVPLLEARGHEVITVDLPCEDEAAGLDAYADAIVAAIGDRPRPVLVAQSMGGLSASLACDRAPVALLILVAAMVPKPGETGGEWWGNTGQGEAMLAAAERGGWSTDDDASLYLHDVPADVAAEGEHHLLGQSGRPFEDPWPLDAWPDVPTRFLLCRDDRLFPAELQRRVVRERLGIVPDEMDGGHLPALAHPDDLAHRLHSYWAKLRP